MHKIQTERGGGGGSGVEDINFPGILKKYHVEILGFNCSTEKEVQFPGLIKRCNTILQNFQISKKLYFVQNFQG